MIRCKHESCGAEEKVWLPYEFVGRSKGLKPHPYCIHCGVVKNISPDRAKPLGYYVNELAKMPITKLQMRLIIKELEALGFDDTTRCDDKREGGTCTANAIYKVYRQLKG